MLTDVDCELAFAVDGREALTTAQAWRPDLILLDVMLPHLSGFEVCQQLKQDLDTYKIVILMITGLDDTTEINLAVTVGADDFLTKPVAKADLVKRVENLLKLKDVRDQFSS
ncbi:MAG TPA: response regulator [Pirellulaceae bacterium]|nr:response regulator [Pirellulaceae bacterium]